MDAFRSLLGARAPALYVARDTRLRRKIKGRESLSEDPIIDFVDQITNRDVVAVATRGRNSLFKRRDDVSSNTLQTLLVISEVSSSALQVLVSIPSSLRTKNVFDTLPPSFLRSAIAISSIRIGLCV